MTKRLELTKTFFTPEDIAHRQEVKLGQSLDAMNVVKFSRELQHLTTQIEELQQKPDQSEELEKVKGIRERTIRQHFERLCVLDDNAPISSGRFFWNVVFNSADPKISRFATAVEAYSLDNLPIEARSQFEESLVDRTLSKDDVEYLMRLAIFAKGMKDKIRGGDDIDIDAWLQLEREYLDDLTYYNSEIEKVTPDIHKRFAKVFVERLSRETDIPISEEEILDRIKGSVFKIKDPLLKPQTQGVFSSDTRVIDIDLTSVLRGYNECFSREALNVFYHELLHVLSTSQLTKYKKSEIYESGSRFERSFISRWSGFSFAGIEQDRFTWINEAVTEDLATKMSGIEDPIAYTQEMELLTLLLSKGCKPIDKRLVYNAYFEVKNSLGAESFAQGSTGAHEEMGVQDRMKHWQAFVSAIREAYPHDQQFFVKLDSYIQKNGIDAALEVLRNWNPSAPTKVDGNVTVDANGASGAY